MFIAADIDQWLKNLAGNNIDIFSITYHECDKDMHIGFTLIGIRLIIGIQK